MLVKHYGAGSLTDQRRYSPAHLISAEKMAVSGAPDMKHVSTSYVERANLTMRMGMRRFTRLTNAFSKKAENHAYAVAQHFMHYNYCRTHKTLRMTPAMAAGLVTSPWEVEDLVAMVEAAMPAPAKRGPCKKRARPIVESFESLTRLLVIVD